MSLSQLAQKLANFRAAIKQHNGFIGSFLQLYRTDELKPGTLVGEDKFGNKYYQNKSFFMGRSRWVDFSDEVGMDYDATQIPAEWHRWLQYMGDEPPSLKPPVPRKWRIDHEQNVSGSSQEYVPYSTTRPKIEAWQPKSQ